MADIPKLLKGEGGAIGFLKEAYDAGKGVTEAVRALREAGLGIADKTAREIYNYLSGPLNVGREYVSNLSLEALPNVSKLAPSLTPTLRNYSYIIEFTGKLPFTGEATTTHVTVSTNTLISKGEALDLGSAYAEGDGKSGNVVDASGQIVDVLVNSAGIL